MTIKDLGRVKPEAASVWNGQKWTRILGMSALARSGEELHLVLRSGERISCTPSHKWPTNRGLLEARNLRIGDVLQTCRLPEPENPKDCIIDEDAAWFAGLYVAEGAPRESGIIRISGHIKETDRKERLIRLARKFAGTIRWYFDDGKGLSIHMSGSMLHGILNELVGGRTAKDKCFSPRLWKYSNKVVAAMVEGYLSGDGHYEAKNDRWLLGFTRNLSLARDLRTACARLGYFITLRPYLVPFKGKKFKSFRGEIRKKRSGHHNERERSAIVAIKKGRCRQVWEIGVEDEPHIYSLASGILTHNSKPDSMPKFNGQGPSHGHECIVSAWCGSGYAKWNGGGRRGLFTHLCNSKDRDGRHPTEKPISLMVELITLFTNPGDMVCDPFMGSGATGIACVKTGRRFIGIEKDEKYFSIARERIAQALSQPDMFIENPKPVQGELL